MGEKASEGKEKTGVLLNFGAWNKNNGNKLAK
jgi:hypothetical protein